MKIFRMVMLQGSLVLFSSAICCVIIFCNSSIERQNSGNNVAADNSLKEVFSREGFISRDLFRVVIVKPAESELNNISQVESLGKKRAYMTLKNHLLSQERIITPNVNAKLLNLVNNNGKITCFTNDTCATRKVFFYEIRKENLRGYVDRMAQRR